MKNRSKKFSKNQNQHSNEYFGMIKAMFGSFIAFLALFSFSYIRGIFCFDDIYSLLDATLPFIPFIMASVIGCGIASFKYEKTAEVQTAARRAEKVRKNRRENTYAEMIFKEYAYDESAHKDKKIDYERRYIIKTYSREGVSKKHICTRHGCGMAKSA